MASTGEDLARAVVAAAQERLLHATEKIKNCLDQLTDDQVWWRPRESQNSVGNIILHLCGNVRQWLVAGLSGEPDQRDRPREFSERGPIPKSELIPRLEEAVTRAVAVLVSLATPEQLLAGHRIQGFDMTALGAIFDSVPHFQGHAQEIIYVTRLLVGDAYRFQWAPATKEQGALA
jgi:hypothetical protein